MGSGRGGRTYNHGNVQSWQPCKQRKHRKAGSGEGVKLIEYSEPQSAQMVGLSASISKKILLAREGLFKKRRSLSEFTKTMFKNFAQVLSASALKRGPLNVATLSATFLEESNAVSTDFDTDDDFQFIVIIRNDSIHR